jgi:serine/threonine protein kinase
MRISISSAYVFDYVFCFVVERTADSQLISAVAKQKNYINNFKELLAQKFITGDLNPTKFDKTISKIMFSSYANVKGCTTPELASEMYIKFSLMTTRTIKMYSAIGIVIDGELPGAVSHYARFVRILNDGRIRVFKYPKDLNNTTHIQKILKDCTFCELVKMKNEGKALAGLVSYEHFTITTFENVKICGNLSDIYVMTVADLRSRVDIFTLSNIYDQVAGILERVHTLGLVIVDLKPSNLFLTVDMQVHIGDFGGALAFGDPLVEYTLEYIPDELLHQNRATYAIDWYCLAVSVLELLGAMPTSTIHAINAAVSKIENNLLKLALQNRLSA